MGGRGEGKITITTIALTWRNTDTPHAFTIEGGPPYSKLSWQCTVDLQAFSWAVRLLVASLIYMHFTLAEGSLCEVCNNTYTVPRCSFLWLLSDNTLIIASSKDRFLNMGQTAITWEDSGLDSIKECQGSITAFSWVLKSTCKQWHPTLSLQRYVGTWSADLSLKIHCKCIQHMRLQLNTTTHTLKGTEWKGMTSSSSLSAHYWFTSVSLDVDDVYTTLVLGM